MTRHWSSLDHVIGLQQQFAKAGDFESFIAAPIIAS